MLIFARDAPRLSGFIVKEAVAGKTGRNERHDPSTLRQGAEHCAYGVAVPAVLQLHRAPHDAIRAHQELKLLVHILDAVGDLPTLYMVVFQYLVDRVLGNGAVVGERRLEPLSHHGGRHVRKGLGKRIVVVLPALFYLFVKPTHRVVTSYSLDTRRV